MRVAVVLALLALAAAVAAADSVSIGVTHKPEHCDRKAKQGDTLEMHYTGTLAATGEKFDSSLDRGQTFSFKLGVGQVIQGWDQGLLGACVGEKRTLKIPASLGYGARGAGAKIPPNSDLVFTTEVVSIKS